jgi:hypothetical protein
MVTYQPPGALRLLSMENGVPSAKGLDKKSSAHSLVPYISGPYSLRLPPMEIYDGPSVATADATGSSKLREWISQAIANVDESQLLRT